MDMDANAASDCGRKLFLEFKHDADITPVYGELVRPAGLGVMASLMVVMTTVAFASIGRAPVRGGFHVDPNAVYQSRKDLGRKPSRAEFKGVSFKSLYVA